MKSSLTKGMICLKDGLNIEYRVCALEYLLSEDGSFEYRFYPNYEVIDLLDVRTFQGIPGLDLDLRKEVYVRENIVPVFVSERVPSKKREDFHELLQKEGMTYMDPIEYLIKSKERYSGDRFYLIPYQAPKTVDVDKIKGKANAFGLTKMILAHLASNNRVCLRESEINDPKVFKTLHYLYWMQCKNLKDKQAQGIKAAQEEGHYAGRKKKKVDILVFLDFLDRVKRKELTNKQAAQQLGISIDKFYRVRKELQNQDGTLLPLLK